jgi:hypothetical protein
MGDETRRRTFDARPDGARQSGRTESIDRGWMRAR